MSTPAVAKEKILHSLMILNFDDLDGSQETLLDLQNLAAQLTNFLREIATCSIEEISVIEIGKSIQN